jgi:hypothetical protein
LETYIIFTKVENWRSEVSPSLLDESTTLYLINCSVMSFFIGDISYLVRIFFGGVGGEGVCGEVLMTLSYPGILGSITWYAI